MACITLLSDFGLQDASVAIAKGILLQHNPGMPIIDISHEVPPFNRQQAAYLLTATWPGFPAGTVHLLLFDLFSEKVPRMVMATQNGHYFLTADNGLLPLALNTVPMAWQIMETASGETFTDWLHAAGRAITQLQATGFATPHLPPYQLSAVPESIAALQANYVACEVQYIDRYENVVLNITRQQFEIFRQGRTFRLQFAQVEEINEISANYADVKPGIKLCRFNSNGHMEICVNKGNAASLFGLRIGGKKNEIKITFE